MAVLKKAVLFNIIVHIKYQGAMHSGSDKKKILTLYNSCSNNQTAQRP